MPFLIGGVLALAVVVLARQVSFDRDRAFYPTLVIVVASYYVLFAVLSGSLHTILAESVVMAAFAGVAVAGFRSRPWIATAALAGHGLFDAVHGHVLHNTGMPAWWPAFCGSFDLVAAIVCAALRRAPGNEHQGLGRHPRSGRRRHATTAEGRPSTTGAYRAAHHAADGSWPRRP